MSAEQPAVPAVRRVQLPAIRRGMLSTRRISDGIRTMANNRENNEFLPAHLEILDTPVSPMAMAFTWTLCLTLASALAWSCFAKIDIHAVALGRIQPIGRSKVVQPFETSKVKAILVQNGMEVHAGDPLIQLDATDAAADLDAKRTKLEAIDSQIARYRSAIAAVKGNQPGAEPEFLPGIPDVIKDRERAAMMADVADYLASRQSLIAQMGEKRAQQQRLRTSIAARQRLVDVLNERATMRKTLVASSAGTKAAVIDAVQQVEQASADLAYDQGSLSESEAALSSIDRKMEQVQSTAIAKQTQALAEASESRDTAVQDVVKAALRNDRMQLRAPIDGTVQQLAVTTVGQVVTASQPLLVIVPSSGPIDVEALVLNQDIGFVVPGQEAVVKIDAFPYTRYGMIEGKVLTVSRDAIDNHEAGMSGDAVSAARGQGSDPTSATPATQNLVFPVTVELDRSSITADGKVVQLTPGMTASVEIRTGSRRVIDYVLAPIKETTSMAGHER